MICDEASSQEDSNGTESNSTQIQLQELPPDWVALEDPDSGDIYYSNEVRIFIFLVLLVNMTRLLLFATPAYTIRRALGYWRNDMGQTRVRLPGWI